MSIPSRSFLLRHQLISKLADWNFPGLKKISIALPKLLLPDPGKTGKHRLRTLHGIELIIDPSVDKGDSLTLFQNGTYDKETVHLLGEFIKAGSTFIDIGATIGLLSVVASQLAGENGKVFAVEADPVIAALLLENLELNSCSNAKVIVGLSYSDAATADRIFAAARPDVVRIHSPGSETEILESAKSALLAHFPVLIISDPQDGKAIAGFIKSLGSYAVFRQKGNGKKRVLIEMTGESELLTVKSMIAVPLRKSAK